MAILQYRYYLIAILIVITLLNSVDLLALGVVMQDIKSDLHVSDTQLGLLTGITFAINSVVGIALARWADRGNRITLLALTTAAWGVLVALCGRVENFSQLLLMRIGVAAGGAGYMPTSRSLIADYFERPDRPCANAIYQMGMSLGPLVGLGVGGWLSELYGWRSMFVVLGSPGTAVAIVVWLTLREPRLEKASQAAGLDGNSGADSNGISPEKLIPSSLKEVALQIWGTNAIRHLLLSLAIISFFLPAGPWLLAFFVRSFGLKTGELGTSFAVIAGVGGMLGSYFGGMAASRYSRNNERLQLKGAAIVNAVSAGCGILLYFTHNSFVGYTLLGLTCFLSSSITGPVWATIQSLVSEHMRATAAAIVGLLAGLIGGGLGPLATGALSDLLQPLLGGESLRYTLLALSPGVLWASWHLWKAGVAVTRDLSSIHGSSAGAGSTSSLPIEDSVTSL